MNWIPNMLTILAPAYIYIAMDIFGDLGVATFTGALMVGVSVPVVALIAMSVSAASRMAVFTGAMMVGALVSIGGVL